MKNIKKDFIFLVLQYRLSIMNYGNSPLNQHKFFFLYYFFIPDSKLYDMSSQSSIQGNQPSTALSKPYIPKYYTKLQHECKYLWQYLAYFFAHFFGMNG